MLGINQSNQHSVIVFRQGLGLKQVFPNFLTPCTPSLQHFVIMYEHVSLKFLMKKRLRKITKIYLPLTKHLILKIRFTDVDL